MSQVITMVALDVRSLLLMLFVVVVLVVEVHKMRQPSTVDF